MRLGEVDAEAGAVAPERVPVGTAGRRRTPAVGAGGVGHDVEGRQPHGQPEPRRLGPDAVDHPPEERGAAVEVAAVGTGAIAGRQQLVEQVAVAVLHVDEVEPGPPGQHRGPHVVVDQGVELGVAEHRRVARRSGLEPDAAVEQRMAVGDARARRAVGPAPTARVGELQAHDRPGGRATGVGMGRHQVVAQRGEGVDRVVADHELAGVGAPVGAYCGGLGPHDPRPAGAEPPPPPAHQLRGGAVGAAVPPLHRQHAEAVGRLPPGHRERLGERAARVDLGVDGQVEPEVSDAAGELGWGPQRADLHDVDLGGGTFDHGRRL